MPRWQPRPAAGDDCRQESPGRRTLADDLAQRVTSDDAELLGPELLSELLVGIGELARRGRVGVGSAGLNVHGTSHPFRRRARVRKRRGRKGRTQAF